MTDAPADAVHLYLSGQSIHQTLTVRVMGELAGTHLIDESTPVHLSEQRLVTNGPCGNVSQWSAALTVTATGALAHS